MSKIGKKPINLPLGVTVTTEGKTVKINGPRGDQEIKLVEKLSIEQKDSQLILTNRSEDSQSRALYGLTRNLLANSVEGVTKGFSKTLELSGIGFRASLQGNKLVLNIGYSHSVEVEAPEGIIFKVAENKITVEGVDKSLVGEVAAGIRGQRPPEPYKGKGIRYQGEVIRRKAGKAGKADIKV